QFEPIGNAELVEDIPEVMFFHQRANGKTSPPEYLRQARRFQSARTGIIRNQSRPGFERLIRDRTLVVWTKSQHRFMLTRVKMQFDLNLAMQFRCVGDDLWLAGYTERVAADEVLFRSAVRIEPASRIEMV